MSISGCVSWVVKNMDIVGSSITSTYVADKTQNSILKISLFHDTMGEIAEQKLVRIISFWIIGSDFSSHSLPDILTKHNITETSSKVSYD